MAPISRSRNLALPAHHCNSKSDESVECNHEAYDVLHGSVVEDEGCEYDRRDDQHHGAEGVDAGEPWVCRCAFGHGAAA
eukprot:CAMPEP_0115871188 /NCGR_PEP_ID=MMETSP0287-20121206/22733_1 /TAXON_ID=412157 /ORGANISM="Chrysochromulina rotalis, Strain UIO044" /LENGTH=78 /DNA_ID=CAMNT_0003325973 /DNA_START=228 /DNA_END=461 /DNA_ORIENTATION=+